MLKHETKNYKLISNYFNAKITIFLKVYSDNVKNSTKLFY